MFLENSCFLMKKMVLVGPTLKLLCFIHILLIDCTYSRPVSADDDAPTSMSHIGESQNLRLPHAGGSQPVSPQEQTVKYGLQKSDMEVERLLLRISDQFETIEDLRRELKQQYEVFLVPCYMSIAL
jgi:hypothetical protein